MLQRSSQKSLNRLPVLILVGHVVLHRAAVVDRKSRAVRAGTSRFRWRRSEENAGLDLFPWFSSDHREETSLTKPERLMNSINRFRAKICADMKRDYGEEYDSFETCVKFMEEACRPGSDNTMDGDRKERPSGKGYCTRFFPEAEEKAKKEIEEEDRLAAEKAAAEKAAAEKAAAEKAAAEKAAAEKAAAEKAAAEKAAAEKAAAEKAAADKKGAESEKAAEAEGGAAADGGAAKEEGAAAEEKAAAADKAAAAEKAASAGKDAAAGAEKGGEGKAGGGDEKKAKALDAAEGDVVEEGKEGKDAAAAGDGGAGKGAGGHGPGAPGGASSGAAAPPIRDFKEGASTPGSSTDGLPPDEAYYFKNGGKDPSRFHMSEKMKLPTQGYHGPLVEHNDMKTGTSDWEAEFGNSDPEQMKSICNEHPDSHWCREKGLFFLRSSSPFSASFAMVLLPIILSAAILI